MNRYDSIPKELKDRKLWCVWRYEQKPGKEKPDKVPYSPLTGCRARINDPASFCDFETAVEAAEAYSGLGAGVFGDVVFIDIDHCVEDGKQSALAQAIIARMNSPAEISPSGTGVRIMCLADGFAYDKARYYINNRKLGLEVYVAGATQKFVTITGDAINTAAFGERGEHLQALLDEYMIRPVPLDISNVEACSNLTDEEVIRKAMAAENGEKFNRLWHGDSSDYNSPSEADMGLAGMLAFWCGRDHDQMERLFAMSAPGQRDKWARDDYRRRTLATAISGCRTVYTPGYGKSDARDDFNDGFSGGGQLKPLCLIKPAVEVTSRDVPWAIEGLLIKGAITGIQGLPDSGKSFFTCALAVAKANGGEFPRADGTMTQLKPGRVLIANFDDALEFGIKPRLENLGLTASGAERISFLDPAAAVGITFDDPRLAAVFEQCKPELAIFDTLQHFIGGKVDLHRANETNAAMAQLKLLAERYDTAVVIVQHISKNAAGGNGGASVLWGLGSTAINGLFRAVWTVGRVQGEDETLRAAVSSKNNLLPYVPPALQYSLSRSDGFQWRGVSREVTAGDLIRGDSVKHTRGRPSAARDEAEGFILETLAFGKVKASEVFSLAEQDGISARTVKRAKSRMGIRTFQEGREWYWDMPKGGQGADIP